MQLSLIICFAAASLAMATPVRQTKLATRTGAIQRRAALAQEATQPEPAQQPDEEDEDNTNEIITSLANQFGDLIFNDETGDDIATGLSAILEIFNRA